MLLPTGTSAQNEKSKLLDAYLVAGDKAYQDRRYEIAEIMFLAARKEADYFGPDNYRVAETLYRLAQVFEAQEKSDKAEALYKEALAIWAKDLGPKPAEVAERINELATYYYDGGKYLEAVELYERARAIGRNKSELAPPTIGTVFSNIALVISKYNTNDAEKLYKQLLAIMQNHSATETLDVDKAFIYLRELNDKEDEAQLERLYDKALKTQVKDLGSRASDFAILMNGLSHLYYTRSEWSKAEELGNRALEIQTKILAPDDPSITTTQNTLADVFFAEEKYEDAEHLYKKVLAKRAKTFGPASIDLVATLNDLGRVYKKLEEYIASEITFKEALRILENAPGSERAKTSDHPSMGTVLNNLSHLYFIQKDYDKAELLLKQALISQKEASDEDKMFYLNNLSVMYAEQERYAEAESLLQQVIAFRIDHRNQSDMPAILERYSSLLQKLKRGAAAEKWQARAEAMRKNNPPRN